MLRRPSSSTRTGSRLPYTTLFRSSLGLNEDLAESLALAHDLGHTPFGHAGEDALDRAMEDHGGFQHNDQTLRILTRLERRYADFDGLNLTWETLEGVVKHNGPLAPTSPGTALPRTIGQFNRIWDLEDRKSVVEGKGVSVGVDLGGRRIIKKK